MNRKKNIESLRQLGLKLFGSAVILIVTLKNGEIHRHNINQYCDLHYLGKGSKFNISNVANYKWVTK